MQNGRKFKKIYSHRSIGINIPLSMGIKSSTLRKENHTSPKLCYKNTIPIENQPKNNGAPRSVVNKNEDGTYYFTRCILMFTNVSIDLSSQSTKNQV